MLFGRLNYIFWEVKIERVEFNFDTLKYPSAKEKQTWVGAVLLKGEKREHTEVKYSLTEEKSIPTRPANPSPRTHFSAWIKKYCILRFVC